MSVQNLNIPFQPLPHHSRFRNLTGRTFADWIVLQYAFAYNKHQYWQCRCICGEIKVISGASLQRATSTSCGCQGRVRTIRSSVKHGHAKAKNQTKEYIAYVNAKARTSNPRNNQFADYGGRGIKFRFSSFEEWIDELGFAPTPQHQIDRIDNDGHYEPGNVQWAVKAEQMRNRRSNRWLTVNGVTKILTDWATDHNHFNRTQDRLNRGWCDTCSVLVPAKGPICTHRHCRVTTL